MVDVSVRVEPEGSPAFQAVMKAGILRTFVLLPGVRVHVKHKGTSDVVLDDDDASIPERNAAILKR
jgi:hypothetical protein